MSENRKDIVSLLISESEAYGQLVDIERLVDSKANLAHIPVQPLYMALRSCDSDAVAKFLPYFSAEQRETFLDLDLWQKDDLDVHNFEFWLEAFGKITDEQLRSEFSKSDQFILYLKSVTNIWTFDQEDPMYPDHDYYFLTEDSLLLFEYDQNFQFVDEIKAFIREIYSELGVEKAYSFLFKLVSESFDVLQEDQYRLKKRRLRDYGFVDYYDSLIINNALPSLALLKNEVKKKAAGPSATGEIDALGQGQALHGKCLTAFKSDMNDLLMELEKINDEKRGQFLRFNFIRLINCSLSFSHAVKEGSVAMTQVGQYTRTMLNLGLSYVKKLLGPESIVLEKFDFFDLHKYGQTLTRVQQKSLKSKLRQLGFNEENDSFFGDTLSDVLNNSFSLPVQYKPSMDSKPEVIQSMETYERWSKQVEFLLEMLPLAKNLFLVYKGMKEQGLLQDKYYLNYNVSDIDFESVLLSSLANFCLGNFDQDNPKLGISIEEYKKFVPHITPSNGNIFPREDAQLAKLLKDFCSRYGLGEIKGAQDYIYNLCDQHLSGYDFKNLDDDEYKHVGGPIIFAL